MRARRSSLTCGFVTVFLSQLSPREPRPPLRRRAMTTRSMFGEHPTKGVAPSFGFGKSTRETAGKVFVSQEHTALATAGKHSPGPAVYLLPPSVGGKQPDGRKADPPVWGFGTGQRFRTKPKAAKPDGHRGNNPGPGAYGLPPASVGPQVLGRHQTEPLMGFGTAERKHVRKVWISQEHMKVDMHGMESPGPAAPYTLKSTLGKQDDSTAENPPAWVFGGATRTKLDAGGASPGPQYVLPQSIGPQPDSRYPAAGTAGFGASTRDIRAKIYVGPGHDKGMYGMHSPGPFANYQTIASVGNQVHSKMRSAQSVAFTRASRWASYEREIAKNSTPGPGAY